MNPATGLLLVDSKDIEQLQPTIAPLGPEMDTPIWIIGQEGPEYAQSFKDIDQFYNYMENNVAMPIPEVMGAGTYGIQKRLQAIFDNRLAEQDKVREEIKAKQASWSWPKNPKVFCYTTRFSTVMKHQAQGLLKGFEKIGCETRFAIERDGRERYSIGNHYLPILREIRDFEPDLILNINFYRLPELHGTTIPYYTWVQDRIRNFSTEDAQGIKGNDFIGMMVKGWVDKWVGYGFPREQMMEHPCNYDPDMFYPGNEKREGLVYVEQNGARTPFQMFKQLYSRHSTEVRSKLIEFYGRCSDLFAMGEDLFEDDYKRIMDDIENNCDDKRLVDIMGEDVKNLMMHDYYREVGNRWIRQRPLAEMKDLPLSLYGNGWEAHPLLGKCAKGAIEYKDLPNIYRKAKVVIQLQHECTMVHRTVEGLACGANLMVRHLEKDSARASDYVKCTEFKNGQAVKVANTLLHTEPLLPEQTGVLDYRYEVWAKKILDWIGGRHG